MKNDIEFGTSTHNGKPVIAYITDSSGVIETFTEDNLTKAQLYNIHEHKKFKVSRIKNRTERITLSCLTDNIIADLMKMLSPPQHKFMVLVGKYMTEDNLIYFKQKGSNSNTIIEEIASEMEVTERRVREILHSIPNDIINATKSGIEMEYMISSQVVLKKEHLKATVERLHHKIGEQPTSESFISKTFNPKKDWLRTGTLKNNYYDSANRTDHKNGGFRYPTTNAEGRNVRVF